VTVTLRRCQAQPRCFFLLNHDDLLQARNNSRKPHRLPASVGRLSSPRNYIFFNPCTFLSSCLPTTFLARVCRWLYGYCPR
jgi:hypothetical protein